MAEYTLVKSPRVTNSSVHEPVPGGVRSYTFIPYLSFGGGNTGITYGTQVGTATIYGRRVQFEISITLTSKGSSVGAALVQGAPFELQGVAAVFPVYWDSLNTAFVHVVGLGGQGNPSPENYFIALLGITAAATSVGTQLTNANFTNTSTINISGSYFGANNPLPVV